MLYLFDFDGTIANTLPGVSNSLRYAFQTLGYASPPDEMMKEFLGPPLSEPMRNMMGMPDEDIAKAIELFRGPYNAGEMFNCTVMPGMAEVIRKVRAAGHTAAIVSAKPEPFVQRIVAHLGLADAFDVIAGADMAEQSSGKTENIARAMQICGYAGRNQEVRMIGDRRYDIEAAKANQVPTIGVLFGYGSRAELETAGADQLVGTAQELENLLLYGTTQKPLSTGRKIWDILNPVLVFLGLSVIISWAVSMVIALVRVVIQGEGFGSVLSSVTKSALLLSFISFLAIIVVQYFVRKRDDRRFGEDTKRWDARKILLSAALMAVFGVVGNILLGLSKLEELFPAYEEIAQMAFQNQNPILLILATAVAGPIAEELTFRGLVQRRAIAYTKPWIGIVIASLLFGLMHMNMVQFVYATPLGLLLGYLYYKSDDMLVPILGHMAANGIVIALAFL